MVKLILLTGLLLFPGLNVYGRKVYRVESSPAKAAEENFVVKHEVDKEEVYVGEQVIYTFKFYRRAPVLDSPALESPPFPSCIKEDLGTTSDIIRSSEGRNYVLTKVKYAIFPLETGRINLGSAEITVTVEGVDGVEGVFQFKTEEEKKFATEDLFLEVKPLPDEGKPADFSGAVGDFTMRVKPEKNIIDQGEPVILAMEVKGRGDLRLADQPVLPRLKNFKVIDTETSYKVDKKNNNIYGEKFFLTTLVSSVAGKFEISPVKFSYFNPINKEYLTAKTRPISIEVKSASGTLTTEDREFKKIDSDIKGITGHLGKRAGEPFYRKTGFKLIAGLPLYLWLFALGTNFLKKFSGNPKKSGELKKAKIKEKLQKAQKKLEAGETGEVYKIIEDIAGFTENLPGDGKDILNRAREFGYSPKKPENPEKVRKDLDRFIDIINKTLKTVVVLSLLCPFLAFGRGHAAEGIKQKQDVEKTFQKANKFYRNGEYSLAVRNYKKILNFDRENRNYEGVFYNLGNTYWKLKKTGLARLYWERAYKVNPKNKDAENNIDLLKEHINDKNFSPPFYGKILETVTPGNIILIVVAGGWIFSLSFLGFYLWGKKELIWPGMGGGIIFLGMLIVFHIVYTGKSVSGEAVIVRDSNIYSDPADKTAQVGKLSEGEKVLFKVNEGGWVQVLLADEDIRVWLPEDKIKKI
ncbi:MAG: BatD family protein [Elusimicrobiota bacterium]